jgi:hypothetical protein
MNNVILRSQITLQLSLGATIKCKVPLSRTYKQNRKQNINTMYNVSQVNPLKFISLVLHIKYTPKDPQLTFSIFLILTCPFLEEYVLQVEKIFKKIFNLVHKVMLMFTCLCGSDIVQYCAPCHLPHVSGQVDPSLAIILISLQCTLCGES